MRVFELMAILGKCNAGDEVLIGTRYTTASSVLSVLNEDNEVVICGEDVMVVIDGGEDGPYIHEVSKMDISCFGKES
jgi:hypothetical protein